MKILDRTLRSVAVGRRFAPQLAEHKRSLATVVVLSLVSTALELVRPWPLKWILDEALVPAGEPTHGFWFVVGTAAGVLLVVSLGRAGLEYLRAIRLAEIGHKVTRTIRTRIFAHLADLSPRFHARHKSGDLLVRLMGDVPMLRTMLVDSTMELATRGLLVAGMLTWMFSKDPLLTSVLLAVLPALFLTVRFISRRITAAVRKQRKKEGLLADFLHEAVAASSTIQTLGREKDTVRRFARDNRSSARAGLKATRLAARLSATVESMLGVVMAGTLAFGAWRVSTGELTLGELTWFLSYVRGMLKPIRSAARHGERVGKGTACGERILEVLDEDIAVRSAPGAPPAPEHPRTLGFERVTFAYEDGDRALDDFTATLDAGELVGVFGSSGAGKSTMAALGLRLYDPDAGIVRLDGVDIRSFDLESLRGRFALCMQETVLFGDTIRENLLLGHPEATDDQLWQALEDAAAADFVRALPDGMDTQLGTAGVGLSGGQRHRIALARTLLRTSPIVILDEPFAGLDHAAVERLCVTLRSRCKDGLVVIITHEIQHLDSFDRVLFVDAGQVVGAGSHRTLLARQDAYRDVVGTVNGSGR